ncbi:MAG: cytochrome-c peroxidase, partial [Acidobacteriota bacterium]
MIRNSLVQAAILVALIAAGQASAQPGRGPGQMMHGRMMGSLPSAMTSDQNPITDAKVDLGRMLFYDTRLSAGAGVSCNSCHSLMDYGVDGKAVSSGHKGQQGT